MNIILIYFTKKYKGDWDAIYKALEEKEKVSLAELNELEQEIKDQKLNIITILDIDYPNKLKEAYKPPFVLFYEGDRKVLNSKLQTVSGDELTEGTEARIQKLATELKEVAIATPASSSVDKKILSSSKLPAVIILDSGLDVKTAGVGKDLAREGDLIITEYPSGAVATKDTTRNKNRLIAAFGDSLTLLSSTKDGQINHLVTNFLNLGKEIYCFPGNGDEKDGNSELIKQGANLVTSVADIER